MLTVHPTPGGKFSLCRDLAFVDGPFESEKHARKVAAAFDEEVDAKLGRPLRRLVVPEAPVDDDDALGTDHDSPLVDLLDGTAREIVAYLREHDVGPADLDALLEAERARPKPRSTVIAALEGSEGTDEK